MSKELKNFISEHRREFDDVQPPAHLWDKIDQQVRSKKKGGRLITSPFYKWAAAAAILIVAAGVYFYQYGSKAGDGVQTTSQATNSTESRTSELGRLAPEYATTAKRIFQSIEQQQEQLKAVASEVPGLYEQFSADLAALDSSYKVLKSRAEQRPGREEIIKAMLMNLQLQAQLLSKQLLIINEFKNNKTDKNEKTSYRPV